MILNRTDCTNDRDSRKAGYVLLQLKIRKLTGELDQSKELYLRVYKIFACQNRPKDQPRAAYFVNTIDGGAGTFIFNNASETMSFEETATMVNK